MGRKPRVDLSALGKLFLLLAFQHRLLRHPLAVVPPEIILQDPMEVHRQGLVNHTFQVCVV